MDTKKNWITGTKLLEGNRYSLRLDFFFPILTVLATFWKQNPDFFSIFQLPIFVEPYHHTYVHQCRALMTRLKHTISPYSGIVWVLFYNI